MDICNSQLVIYAVYKFNFDRVIDNVDSKQELKKFCGGNSVVEFQLPKLATRVRFSSPAPCSFDKYFLKRFAAIAVVCVSIFLSGCTAVYYPDPTPVMIQQGKGVYHVVENGQTLWSIAQAYDVDIDQIIFVNGINNASVIESGQRVFIPGVKQAAKAPVFEVDSDDNTFGWPLRGRVLSYFKSSKSGIWKQGLRIDSNSNAKVAAVRSGTVVFADLLAGYGSTVIVDHQDGFMSVYGNNARLNVGLGDRVRKGDIVADPKLGVKGFVYFEIRRKGVAADPLFYLPKIR